MPNHFTNIILMSGYDESDACESFNADKFQKLNAQTNWCEVLIPQPKDLDDASRPHILTDAAFLWQRDNWGVKWGTYDTRCVDLGGDGRPHVVSFQSPWCAPKIVTKIAEHIAKLGGFERYAILSHDPYDGAIRVHGKDESIETQLPERKTN